jgi:uncharacterized membrane protein
MIWTSKEQVLGTKMFLKLGRGIIDRPLLGLQHVNETVPPGQWIFWDVGFLICVRLCWSVDGYCGEQESMKLL